MNDLLKRKEKKAKPATKELVGYIPRLSSFGVSSQEEKCQKCGQIILPGQQHLKTYDSEYSQKVIGRRCMECVMAQMVVDKKPVVSSLSSAKTEPQHTSELVSTKKVQILTKPKKKVKPTKSVKAKSLSEKPLKDDDSVLIKNVLRRFR